MNGLSDGLRRDVFRMVLAPTDAQPVLLPMINTTSRLIAVCIAVSSISAASFAQQLGEPKRPPVRSGVVTRSIDDATKNPSTVTRLDLSRQKLETLPPEVLTLENLEELVLVGNSLSSLPDGLAGLKKLRVINLLQNKFTQVPEVLRSCTSLLTLGMARNAIDRLDRIGMPQLQSLDLRDNAIGANFGPMAFEGMTALRELDLTNTGITTLPASIGACTMLRTLKLTRNKLTSLPETIGTLAALNELACDRNALTTIPTSLGAAPNLTILDLSGNGITSVPASLLNNRTLKRLSLAANRITMIPDSINTNVLEGLILDSNQLRAIPATIGRCKRLAKLSVRSNELTTLPREIGQCANLNDLDVAGNRLVSLPVKELADLPALNRLSITNRRDAVAPAPAVVAPPTGDPKADAKPPGATPTPTKKKKR